MPPRGEWEYGGVSRTDGTGTWPDTGLKDASSTISVAGIGLAVSGCIVGLYEHYRWKMGNGLALMGREWGQDSAIEL